MSDFTTIATILTSIKTATEIARLIKDSDTSLEKAEFRLKLADLVSSLADAKIEIANIQEIIIGKDNEINELKNQLDIKQKIVWEAPYYFVEDDEERDGPFCQQCYDNNGKLIRLQSNKNGSWHCNTCKSYVYDKTFR